ncbi:cytochrome-c peroxidase [Paucibacter sp. JuS9]|uniref:cytochrome-c peroxidase n=1 Tax=Roseateles TaxID=93681 RepID=UPI002FE64BE0
MNRRPHSYLLLLALGLLLSLGACGGGGGSSAASASVPTPAPPASTPAPVQTLSAMAALGERAFNDRTLSGSGRMTCATCHDPDFAHGSPNALAVQIGGQFESEFGQRSAPSIRYLERQPAFDPVGITGGLTADGRADSLAAQSHLVLFNPLEFDNTSVERLAQRVRASVIAADFAKVFGTDGDAATTVAQLEQALQAFQLEDKRLHPYDSKFDWVQAGKETFTAPEQRGQQVFRDPARGACIGCHLDTSSDGKPPLFTNFGYVATGAPRNAKIPANADPAYFDLGLCGPLRKDLAQRAELCGLFRTPGLRNVAQRQVFFHNGIFSSLPQVLDFYNTRDTSPERWYPTVAGKLQKFDDLPPAYRGNLSTLPPFAGLRPGDKPPMSARDLLDLECFLMTLSDGHVIGTPAVASCR